MLGVLRRSMPQVVRDGRRTMTALLSCGHGVFDPCLALRVGQVVRCPACDGARWAHGLIESALSRAAPDEEAVARSAMRFAYGQPF